MPQRFANPPLAELIVELRWRPGSAAAPMMPAPGLQISFGAAAGHQEEFFMRFGAKVAALGYGRVERTVPPGFPIPPFQAAYRFRKTGPEQGTALYQVGAGIFTANITPPYHSWDQFRPVVEKGLETLLESRSDAEKNAAFDIAVLRYIDAFGDQLTQGRPLLSFLSEGLGFRLGLPDAIKKEMAADGVVQGTFQFLIPLANGQQMGLTIGHGLAAGVAATVMDTAVSASGPIAPNIADVMRALDSAHTVVHNSFVEMSKNLHHIMVPVEDRQE